MNKGEKILIIGPSGSGKSTLGHCLNGLVPFSYRGEITGSLLVNGCETKEMDIFSLSKIIGTVLQDPDGQFVGLTVYEDIAFALENDMVPVSEMIGRVKSAAEQVNMEKFALSSPYELSGGQKQRTTLAGVMIDDVDILLFDEPLANLDPATGKKAIEIIDEIHKKHKKTIVIIEHRLEDVLHRDLDRIILMNDGHIMADLDADNLMASSLLTEIGIREPLYVTALRFAGIKLTKELRAGHLETLEISKTAPLLHDWFSDQNLIPDSPSPSPLLSLENISFSYDGNYQAVDNVSFQIGRGELIAIVGKNGAGKSTLSRIICGFEKEDKGRIYYNGRNIEDQTIKERAGKIGVILQNPNQMISKSLIYDEIALGLRLRHMNEEEVSTRVGKVMDVCGLSPYRKWPISALSYGQKKRVTIASILVLNPEILILDEPTAGQDYRHYSEVMSYIEEINRLGVAIILITHDMHLMLEYASRCLVIADGRKIADAKPSSVLTDPEIIEKANLTETSLFTLSKKAGISNGPEFVQEFIENERRVRYP